MNGKHQSLQLLGHVKSPLFGHSMASFSKQLLLLCWKLLISKLSSFSQIRIYLLSSSDQDLSKFWSLATLGSLFSLSGLSHLSGFHLLDQISLSSRKIPLLCQLSESASSLLVLGGVSSLLFSEVLFLSHFLEVYLLCLISLSSRRSFFSPSSWRCLFSALLFSLDEIYTSYGLWLTHV